jgi:hypothetical protein
MAGGHGVTARAADHPRAQVSIERKGVDKQTTNVVPLNEAAPFANPLVSLTLDSADRGTDYTLTRWADRAAGVSGSCRPFNYAQPN